MHHLEVYHPPSPAPSNKPVNQFGGLSVFARYCFRWHAVSPNRAAHPSASHMCERLICRHLLLKSLRHESVASQAISRKARASILHSLMVAYTCLRRRVRDDYTHPVPHHEAPFRPEGAGPIRVRSASCWFKLDRASSKNQFLYFPTQRTPPCSSWMYLPKARKSGGNRLRNLAQHPCAIAAILRSLRKAGATVLATTQHGSA